MKLYIGAHFRGHDSALCIYNPDSKDLFCMSTERFTRFKHDAIYPIPVINKYIEQKNLDSKSVSHVYIASSFESHEFRNVPRFWFQYEYHFRKFLNALYVKTYSQKSKLYFKLNFFRKVYSLLLSSDGRILLLLKILRLFSNKCLLRNEISNCFKLKFPNATVESSFYNHHLCHALSSFHSSRFQNALCVTIDGYGDNCFSKVYTVNSMSSNEISSSLHKTFDLSHGKNQYFEDGSIGGVYGYFTGLLGFRPLSDEGKVEALAAYGNHDNDLYYSLFKLFNLNDNGDIVVDPEYFVSFLNYKNISTIISQYQREDVAAAVQKWLEEFILSYVKFHVSKTGILNVCLSGGVSANVIMNLRIFEEITKNIYVIPAMTDEGAAQGALCRLLTVKGENTEFVHDIEMPYLGSSYDKEDVLNIVTEFPEISFKDLGCNWEGEVANRIVSGQIGALFQGKAEWGPRALGNRSILADPTNSLSIDRINNKIKRREAFQPFCPSILIDEADRLFENYYLNKHMTCAFRIREEFHDSLPGAIHVDGTARVQFVSEFDNPSYYKIIKQVKLMNGFGVVLNTSFNMHGRTMVESPSDAIRDFIDTGMDYLVIEGILITIK